VADEAQLAHAREVDARLQKNLEVVRQATNAHEQTEVDLATVESASQDAHATALGLEQDLAHQRLALKKAIGLPPDAQVHLRENISLPSRVSTPSYPELTANIEERRLDVLALKKGYESEEEKVRAAILAQFPRISIGFNRASDTSNVHTIGPAVTLDLPIFDRGQGAIALERATRQKLRDEYINRVFEARSDVATALADIQALEKQIAAAEAALSVLQRLVQVYGTAFQQGNSDAFSYYSAQNNLNQKTIQILKLKEQLIETRIALEIAAGRYLPARPNE
jgi:cobalt-zinc-cadmium efflux system outer membrane protein